MGHTDETADHLKGSRDDRGLQKFKKKNKLHRVKREKHTSKPTYFPVLGNAPLTNPKTDDRELCIGEWECYETANRVRYSVNPQFYPILGQVCQLARLFGR